MKRISGIKNILFSPALLMIFLPACSPANKSSANPGRTVIISDAVMANKNTSAVWLAYGFALAEWNIKKPDANASDYFEREVHARTTAAQTWQSLREKGRKPDDALDTMLRVNEAGFMREYVWFYLRRPEWSEPENLRLEEFESWKEKNLAGHSPIIETGIELR